MYDPQTSHNTETKTARIFQIIRNTKQVRRLSPGLARFGVMALFIAFAASAFIYSASSASSRKLPYASEATPPTAPVAWSNSGTREKGNLIGASKELSPKDSKLDLLANVTQPLVALLPQQAPPTESIATYAADCTTPKTSFALGDTVCAKVTGAPTGVRAQRRFRWVSRTNSTVQISDITTGTQTSLYQLPDTPTQTIGNLTVDNRGEWRVVSADTAEGGVRAKALFTVSDPETPTTNLVLTQSANSQDEGVSPGTFATFEAVITNQGPDTAQGVTVTNNVPANTTFQSASGSGFNCTNSGQTTTCTSTSVLPKGAVANLTFIYQVNSGTAAGTFITNSATAASSTTEIEPVDNTGTAKIAVAGAGGGGDTCALDCPNNITVTANTTQGGQSGAFVQFAAAEDSGSCGTITSSVASGSFFAVGTTTTVTFTSSEGGGSCSFTVTVLEEAAPTVSCPPDQTITLEEGQTEATVDPGMATGTGNNITIAGSRGDNQALTDPYPIGATAITWTTTDEDSRVATCTQLITVNPPAGPPPPTISCPPDKTVTAPQGECSATVDVGTPTTTGEDVQVVGRRSDEKALTDPYPSGTTIIIWSATNGSGDASCTQTITVNANDTTPPVVIAPPDIIACAKGSTAKLDDEFGEPHATDECSTTVTIVRTGVPANFVFPLGVTTITYTATDAAGNTATDTQTVTVIVDTPPTITAPAAVTLHTGVGATECSVTIASASLDATLGSATASDSCSEVTIERSGVPAGNTFPIGTTTITYTATDAGGQTATATQVVTVVDDTKPVVTLNGDESVTVECHTSYTELGATATDNCGVIGSVTTEGSVDVNTPGTYTITYSATDGTNTGTATRTVTVVDTVPPTIALNGNSTVTVECHTSYTELGATASDSCAGDLTGAITVSGTVNADAVGSYTLIYSVSDGHKSSSVQRTVNVVDTTAPTLTLNGSSPMTVECHTSFTDPGATASDSCAGDLTSAISVSGSVNINVVGSYTLVYTVSDGHNTTTASRVVNVVDTTAPTITVSSQAINLWPPNHSYQTINVSALVVSATDSCDGDIDSNDVVIEKVTSDEAENSNGDGNTLNDIVIAANCKSVQLRAERNGSGNGRVYTITLRVRDASGNTGRATKQVKVPKNAGNNAVDNGVVYTVTSGCP